MWTTTEELLASLVEVVDVGNRNFIAANSRRGDRPPDPVKIVRPWERPADDEPRKMSTTDQQRAFFGAAVKVKKTEREEDEEVK